MKKNLIASLLLIWPGLVLAADQAKDVWLSDAQGCKFYSRFKKPLDSIEWAGACKDGYLDGAGVLKVFENGIHKTTYSGQFEQGKLMGKGVIESFESHNHEGRLEAVFFNNLAHGPGIQRYPDGRRFEGNFEKGCPQAGVITWPNGVRYEGEFKNCRLPEGLVSSPSVTFDSKTIVYPASLLRYNSQGNVLATMDVTENNQLKNIEVTHSDHPLFEQVAIRSLRQATVKAGSVKGQPVTTPVVHGFPFRISGLPENLPAQNPYPEKASTTEPEMLQYDQPPADKIVAPLVYPLALLKQNVRGTATVSVVIDPAGKPQQLKIVESSEPAFGQSLKAMLASSSFFPARKNKQLSWSAFNIKRKFTQYGTHDIAISEHGQRILEELRKPQPAIAPVSSLDHAPKPFYTPPPVYPPELADQGVTGTVLVEFYIDKEGTVQFPHALNSNNEELAWLALTAVARWQFYPPLVKGVAVDTVVTVPVAFNLNN